MESLLSITELLKPDSEEEYDDLDSFKAYLLKSTAQTSVEASGRRSAIEKDDEKPSKKINDMVDFIIKAQEKNPDVLVNLVIQIHGYNTGDSYVDDYQDARNQIAKIQKESEKDLDDIIIFLGYSWPSEKIAIFNHEFICGSLKSLPGWLQVISLMGIPWIVAGLIWIGMNTFPASFHGFTNNLYAGWFLADTLKFINSSRDTLIVGSNFIVKLLFYITALSPIITILTLVLILLRASVYFRDSYRAIHYGVPDLVQFFRAFEYLLINDRNPENPYTRGDFNNESQSNRYCRLYEKNRIRLSFIGHSMGGFVTTNLVRTLSDVFDSIDVPRSDREDANYRNDALSILDGDRTLSNHKKSEIGKCFTLERLILVSPDIPVNAILSGRSNFLSSSLNRFQESYLFSNEGDLILLLLSTVANYISFPSNTPQMGYKLGNLGVTNHKKKQDQYITNHFNRIEAQANTNNSGNVLRNLIIGVDHSDLIEVGDDMPFVAQEFTYFDCTNYLRKELSIFNANNKFQSYERMTMFNYASLMLNLTATHSGYFKYDDTRTAIYMIACHGLENFEKSSIGIKIIGDKHPIKVLRSSDEA